MLLLLASLKVDLWGSLMFEPIHVHVRMADRRHEALRHFPQDQNWRRVRKRRKFEMEDWTANVDQLQVRQDRRFPRTLSEGRRKFSLIKLTSFTHEYLASS